jgi:hypothetical protein
MVFGLCCESSGMSEIYRCLYLGSVGLLYNFGLLIFSSKQNLTFAFSLSVIGAV